MNDINPGIRRVVEWLNENGFTTCDSGDGETHEHACDREESYVVIRVNTNVLTEESDRLFDLLGENGITVVPIGHDGVSIQASYDPADESALIDVTNIHDRMLKL